MGFCIMFLVQGTARLRSIIDNIRPMDWKHITCPFILMVVVCHYPRFALIKYKCILAY